mmetsp:Transcript_7002/g.20449  ORF Transcript_7002/g.20449 Transcript_7002/m.20449 type:complete len:221 (+) Transcript_7002:589-1251(+)
MVDGLPRRRRGGGGVVGLRLSWGSRWARTRVRVGVRVRRRRARRVELPLERRGNLAEQPQRLHRKRAHLLSRFCSAVVSSDLSEQRCAAPQRVAAGSDVPGHDVEFPRPEVERALLPVERAVGRHERPCRLADLRLYVRGDVVRQHLVAPGLLALRVPAPRLLEEPLLEVVHAAQQPLQLEVVVNVNGAHERAQRQARRAPPARRRRARGRGHLGRRRRR